MRLGEILGEVKRPVTLIPTVGRDAPSVVDRQPTWSGDGINMTGGMNKNLIQYENMRLSCMKTLQILSRILLY